MLRSYASNVANGSKHICRNYATRTPNPLPAAFLRGGTSKGIFINRAHLPENPDEWSKIFLGIMGSPDPEYGRQLNGMGGGVSSLSKICVVGAPSRAQREQEIDAEYTFVQVGIRDSAIDYSGNCGNLSSMIGVFAVDEGICTPDVRQVSDGVATVRSFNTNTNKRIDTTFPVDVSQTRCTPQLDLEQASVAGVPGKASQILLDFVSPGGARTGKLLPTGNPVDSVIVPCGHESIPVRVSLVDATNPTVIVTADDMRTALSLDAAAPIDYSSEQVTTLLEHIRQEGAKRMGLDSSAQAQPKIVVLSHPSLPGVDMEVRAFSMGVLHKAVPMTVGLCLGVAANIENTLAMKIAVGAQTAQGRKGGEHVRILHPGGVVDVGAVFGHGGELKSARVVRTGRRLMKGVVWW